MSRVRVAAFCVSLDGYGAGPGQSLENPLGAGGEQLHTWVVQSPSWRRSQGLAVDDAGPDAGAALDDEVIRRAQEGIGATVMGRNMFGPVRGAWPDPAREPEWRGWWGEDPPFHHPVFVLTHHARPPLEMAGGTTFHFVTGGVHEALERARCAAGELDVRLGGGVGTIRQCLREGLIDELQLSVVPVLLGDGERLLGDLGDLPRYRAAELRSSASAAHVTLVRD